MSLIQNVLAEALHPSSHFEIFEDKAEKWRWRLVANNGDIIADSGQGYVDKRDCQHAIDLVKRSASSPVR